MLKVGRNDICPCGSGKKYKKCCEKKEVVSITSIVDREIVELQNDIINYAYAHYKLTIEGKLNSKFKEFDIHEDQETLKMFTFLGWAWFIFNEPLKGKKRIIDIYIDENMNKASRPQTKAILSSWTEGKSTVSRLLTKEDYEIIIEDIFTNEKKKVKLLSKGSFKEFRIGSLVMGVLVPHGDTYLYFIECTGVDDRKGKEEELIHRMYRDTHIEDPDEFLKEEFPFVLGMIVLGPPEIEVTNLDIDINKIQWVNPVYKMIADNFLMEMRDQPDYMANLGILIWKTYTERKTPAIKSPQIAVAALHYIIDDLFTKTHTQKSLAEHYGVTTGGISSRYRSIYDAVDDVISLIYREIIGPEREANVQRRIEANEREIARLEAEMAHYQSRIQIVDQKPDSTKQLKKPTNQNKEKAQDLIYKAYMEKGTLRAQLAQQARDLDPYNIDAYTILSETSLYTKDALNLAKRGMEIGAEELGKSFFKENKGYFWGLSETRPFMRAKQNYAGCLMEDYQVKEAIKQYEELLELNPMDNQGVRYKLMEAYITDKDPAKAKILLEKYPEETAATMYNSVLIEYLENGKSLKLKKLIKDAKKMNPHVGKYLVNSDRIPMTLPESYGIGDKEEAILYADDFFEYWEQHPDLLKMIK